MLGISSDDAEWFEKWIAWAKDDIPMNDCAMLLNGLIPTQGSTFVEIFSGASSITLGCQFAKVPTMLPWDRCLDPKMDVLSVGSLLIELIRQGFVVAVWIAVPCEGPVSFLFIVRVPMGTVV